MTLDAKQKQIIIGRIYTAISAGENIDTRIYELRKAMMDLLGDIHAIRRFVEVVTIDIPDVARGVKDG